MDPLVTVPPNTPSEPEASRKKSEANGGPSRRTLLTAASLASLGIIATQTAGAKRLPQSSSAVAAVPPGQWGGHQNGQIPFSEMEWVPAQVGPPYLRSDAARAYFDFDNAFRARFSGRALSITEAYRDLARQRELYDDFVNHGGNLAAEPGFSNHGWALACDFGSGVNRFGTDEKAWADANGPAFGWEPTGNSFGTPEPWHFDYFGTYNPQPEPTPPPEEEDAVPVFSTVRGNSPFSVPTSSETRVQFQTPVAGTNIAHASGGAGFYQINAHFFIENLPADATVNIRVGIETASTGRVSYYFTQRVRGASSRVVSFDYDANLRVINGSRVHFFAVASTPGVVISSWGANTFNWAANLPS